jgi:hypothetical protein
MSSITYGFICLISSHVLADFPLQPDKLVELKKSFWGKLLHGAIHGSVAYLICGQWKFWYLPLIVGIMHILIDLIKKENWRYFLLDQCLHLFFLMVLAFILPFNNVRFMLMKPIVIISGFFALTMGCGMLIGQIMDEHIKKNNLETSGLINGGMWIGRLERLLIFLFVLYNISEGIGFLIAAKSILRFSETKEDQRMAEYVLIGTLLSFGLAILISFIVKKTLSVI